MAFCPECKAAIEGEPYELDEGELVECPECGAELEITSTEPLELDSLEEEFDEDDDFDFDDEEWE